MPPVPTTTPPAVDAGGFSRPDRPQSGWGRFFLGFLRYPAKTAAILALILLIAFGVCLIGLQVWGHFQLQAARYDVDHAHNRQAQQCLEAYLNVWPNDATALILASRTARRLGTFGEAERFLDRCEAVRGKDDPDVILERVLLQAQRGRVDHVRDFCEARIEANDPAAPLILEAQAAGLMRDFRLDEAEERLETWLKRRPDDCQALVLHGALLELRQAPEAADDYRRVIQLDPENEEARLRLASLLLLAHEPSEAFPHLEYLRKAAPDNPRVLVEAAQCRVDMGQSDEARKILDEVLTRWPHFPEALAARGRLAKQDGDLAKAEGWLRAAVAADPSAREAHYHLYLCLGAEGKDAEAKEEKTKLDQLEDDLKEIQNLVVEGMQKAPFDPALHTKAGVLALRVGETEEGLRWLESALELDPHYTPAHKALAEYYQQIGDHVRAAQHLAAAKK
jgi:tetratricopeptide (TPR) repeat protein